MKSFAWQSSCYCGNKEVTFRMPGHIKIEIEGALPATDPDLWSDVGHLWLKMGERARLMSCWWYRVARYSLLVRIWSRSAVAVSVVFWWPASRGRILETVSLAREFWSQCPQTGPGEKMFHIIPQPPAVVTILLVSVTSVTSASVPPATRGSSAETGHPDSPWWTTYREKFLPTYKEIVGALI